MRQHLEKIKFKIHHIKNRFKEGNLSRWQKIKYFALGLIGVGFFAFVFLFLAIFLTLPDVDNVRNLVASQSSIVMDREGEVLYTIHGDENRKTIPLAEISKYAPLAVMAIEDDQFYEHPGIDIPAIIKALCSEIGICKARGGSTLTQQFVKNAFLSSERTYTRKAKEMILALQLESKFTKDEIMAMYLNRIPYGANIYGVEIASQKFFGKPAAELTLAESTILAAIPKAPSYYSPYGGNVYAKIDLDEAEIIRQDLHSEQDLVNADPTFISKGLLGKTYTFGEEDSARDIYVKGRVAFVLERMEFLGYITAEERASAQEEADAMEFTPFREDIVAPHFVMYVREMMEEKYGKEQIKKGGLRITTTLSGEMQAAAEEAVAGRAEHNEANFRASNAALISVDPNNGQIMAMVGSRDFWNDEIDGKVNVTLRPRLPGSSFKPISYAAAFLQGYAPSTVLYDVRTKFGSWYEPENYDGKFNGPVSIRQALGASLNIPAVKAGHLAGISNVLDLARKMGIGLNQPDDWYGLSLSLGAGEARPLDMALAYAVFANGGYKVEPVAILKVEDSEGNILEEYEAPKKNELILDPQVAYLINNILSDASARPGEYWRNQLTVPGHQNGAKTGTSNKKKNNINYPFDTWTIGYVRNLSTAVWTGNADGTHLSLSASGLDVASPIWRNFMIEAVKHVDKADFEKPEGIRWVRVAKRSGKLPSEHTPEDEIVSAVFASFGVPTKYDNSYQFVEIDKISGKLATEFTPDEAREKKAFYTHHSILPDNQQWESAVRRWAEENNQDEPPPTEYDDVHTAQTMDTKPEIRITAPSSMSTVGPPVLDVWVSIQSPAGVEKVDYYFDGELMDTSTRPPYAGTIRLPDNLKNGSSHTVRAIVFDEIYRSNQSSITVKIGKDETPPTVNFTYPANGAKLNIGAGIEAHVDARDSNGGISRVRFYLDGRLKRDTEEGPYSWQFIVPDDTGKHELKVTVTDYAGNEATDIIDINAVESNSTLSGNTRILSPSANSSFDEGKGIPINAFITEGDRATLQEVIFLAKKDGQQPKVIGSVVANASGGAETYSVVWSTPPAGTYEIYVKLVLDDEKLRFSTKVPIVVR